MSYDVGKQLYLRLWVHWKVTRSLVSYDESICVRRFLALIERSPDHWWVTTGGQPLCRLYVSLKGHQIIGELRHKMICFSQIHLDWKVTRSLVSYDLDASNTSCMLSIERSPDHWWVTTFFPMLNAGSPLKLKGHQIIGELRHASSTQKETFQWLKGHQIIGELRRSPINLIKVSLDWKVTRSLVSYDSPL